jgi:hypothetical protein
MGGVGGDLPIGGMRIYPSQANFRDMVEAQK